ncbi:hypothetical protein [Fibrella forsythiae]|uniref:Uncharacterized protein n=1 Tax=Fibrella forsythiae TaxID=2817061 RepID=A0ABS3JDU3_9BACT|nr:hypothetical protein [Fibrella forsythiae]MBO0948160.1 hypothetical protein [Fibrella forsythiae]
MLKIEYLSTSNKQGFLRSIELVAILWSVDADGGKMTGTMACIWPENPFLLLEEAPSSMLEEAISRRKTAGLTQVRT